MSKFISILALIFLTFHATAQTNISLIEIDKIGLAKLDQLKSHDKVDWWVEMGSKLVVALNDSKTPLPVFTRVLATHKAVDLSQLAFQSNGHCSVEDANLKNQLEDVISSHDGHLTLESYFTNGGFSLVSLEGVKNKVALMTHSEMTAFEKNKVLTYQFDNREIKVEKQSTAIDNLVINVNEDRYFAQIEKLASYNRLTDAGLTEAGEWLEGQFNDLGLVTSRINPNGFRGFNVLGFKEGTTRPDDWYVVGAHLDSRNSNFNFDAPAPGAEDNASGCSGVLEVANVISQVETEASVLFVCFNAEELGLIGSKDVVAVLRNSGELDKVKFMQNMDMISYSRNGVQAVNAATDKERYIQYAEILAAYGNLYTDIDWQINPDKCCTDFKSFSAVGIPSISSGIPDVRGYEHYHTSTDLPLRLDKNQGAGVVKANLATLADMVGVNSEVNFNIVSAHSGLWYNPEQSGHGVTVEILADNRMLVIWYVFDQLGNQIWLVGVGNYEGNTATVDVTISKLGLFPPEFNSEDVSLEAWGQLKFEFIDCNNVDFSWTPDEGVDYLAGSMQLSRLTAIDGLNCDQQ